MKLTIDLILLFILIVCTWAGFKRGLIMSIGSMILIIISLYTAVILSSAFSYEAVSALRPFASGYVEKQMKSTVLKEMNLADTQLSYEDILANQPELKREFCVQTYKSLGIYDDAAEKMAEEAISYAENQKLDITNSVVEVLCHRVLYVGCIALLFLIILIGLTALANIPNLAFRIPNMETLDFVGGGVMGFFVGFTYCILLTWILRFLGLFIGKETLGHTILGRFFIAVDFITIGIGI
ncbi:MAG: hypothetical protein ACOX04_04505 [Candidatus Scatomorpha sp.]